MSKLALALLSAAYEHYQKSGSVYYEYQARNFTDWLNTVTGAAQLYGDGYIDEVPEFVKNYGVHSQTVSFGVSFPSIDFNLTSKGIDFILRNVESKNEK